MRARAICLAALLAAAPGAAAGCGNRPTTRTVTPKPVRSVFAPGQLRSIADGLARRLGYSPSVRRIVLGPTFAEFEVSERADLGRVDSYRWRAGRFAPPAAVQLSQVQRRSLARDLFPVSVVNLDAASELVQAGNSLEITGARTGTIVIQRDLPFSSNVVWLVDVEGSRESKQIRADAAGRILKVQ